MDAKRVSKTLSLWLRHRPEAAHLELDPCGWAAVDGVLMAFRERGLGVTVSDLREVVETSDKNRFELSPGLDRIRARQGHSVPVDLGWPAAKPPETLFHGTVAQFLAPILREGLRPMGRHHVHLSADAATARSVGSRRGAPLILDVNAAGMVAAGYVFRLSSNGVWLVDHVPPEFLRSPAAGEQPPAG